MAEQTVDLNSSGSLNVITPDNSLSDDLTLVKELQDTFPELQGLNGYHLKKRLIQDTEFFNDISQRYFGTALTAQERLQFQEDPELEQHLFKTFQRNIKDELNSSSYVGNTIRETLVSRTADMGVDFDSFPIEEYKKFIEDDDQFAHINPDNLKQELSKNPQLRRQLLDKRFDEFENELSKQHNPTSVIKDDPTKLSQAWITYDKFGSEGLTQFVNLEQFKGAQVDDISSAFQQLQSAQEFFQTSTVNNKNISEYFREFFNGSPVQDVPYKDIINDKAYKYNIPPSLLAALVRQESSFRPTVRGRAGEVGLGQIMETTGADLGYTPEQLLDPETNLDASAKYLSERLRQFDYNPEIALAAYNWGQGNVQRAIQEYGDNWRTQMPDSTRQYIDNIFQYQQEYGTALNTPVVHEQLTERQDIALDVPPDMNRYMSAWYEPKDNSFYRKDDFEVAKAFVNNFFPEEYRTPEDVERLRRYEDESDTFGRVAYSIYENAVNERGFDMNDLLRTLQAVGEYRQRDDGRDEWIIERDGLSLPHKLAMEALTFSSEYNNMIAPGERRGTFSVVPDRREASVERWKNMQNLLFSTETVVEDGEFVTKRASGFLNGLQNTVALAGIGVVDTVNRYLLEPVVRATVSAMDHVGVDTHAAEHQLAKWHENTLGASIGDLTDWEEDGYIMGGMKTALPFIQYMGAMIYSGRGILAGGSAILNNITKAKKLDDVLRAGSVLKNTKWSRVATNIANNKKAPWVSGVGVYYTGGAAIEATQPSDVSFYKVIPELVGMSPTNDITKMYDQASTAGKVGMDMLGSIVMDGFFDLAIGAAVRGASQVGVLAGKDSFRSMTYDPVKGAYTITDTPQFKTDLHRFWHNALAPISKLPDVDEMGITSQLAGRHITSMKGLAREFTNETSYVMNDIKGEIRKYLDYINKEYGDGQMLSDVQLNQIVDTQYNEFLDQVGGSMASYFRMADDTGETALRFASQLEDSQPIIREYWTPEMTRPTPSEVTKLREEGVNVVRIGDRVYEVDEMYWTTDLASRIRQRTFDSSVDDVVERRLRQENLWDLDSYTDAQAARMNEIQEHTERVLGTPVRLDDRRMGYVTDIQGDQYIIRSDDGGYIRQSDLTPGFNIDRLRELANERLRLQNVSGVRPDVPYKIYQGLQEGLTPSQIARQMADEGKPRISGLLPESRIWINRGPTDIIPYQQSSRYRWQDFHATLPRELPEPNRPLLTGREGLVRYQQVGYDGGVPRPDIDDGARTLTEGTPLNLLEGRVRRSFDEIEAEEESFFNRFQEIVNELEVIQRQYDHADMVASIPDATKPGGYDVDTALSGKIRRGLTRQRKELEARIRDLEREYSNFLRENPMDIEARKNIQDYINAGGEVVSRQKAAERQAVLAKETGVILSRMQSKTTKLPYC